MKAICLAGAMTVVLLLAVTAASWLAPAEHRVRQMAALYVACMVALVGLGLGTPADLGFLHPSLLAEPRWFDLILALFFFSAAFFGGVLQLYNLADRGFSLRILIDVLEHPGGIVTADQLVTGYGGGNGIRWMYDKRMHGLLAGNLVHRRDDFIVLAENGARIAGLFVAIRRVVKMDRPR